MTKPPPRPATVNEITAIKESTAATEATVNAIKDNTGATASAVVGIEQSVKDNTSGGIQNPFFPLPLRPLTNTNEAAMANIAAVVKAGEGHSAEAVKAGVDALTNVTKADVSAVADIAAAQRKNAINLLWEGTQAFLALSLTVAAITSAFLFKGDVPSVLTNALFVVLGFYFGRTNHARPTPTMPFGGEDVGRPRE